MRALLLAVLGATWPAAAPAGDAAPPPPPLAPPAASEAAPRVTPRVLLFPPRATPGDAFLVVVRGASEPPAAVVEGRSLQFFPVPDGFAAIAGLPVETPAGPLSIRFPAQPELEARLEVAPSRFPRRELQLDRRFVEPPSPEVARRIEEDRAAFARAFGQPPAPPLFRADFAWPRKARVSAGFGEERTINRVKPSQHYGLDLAGAVGAPVLAANAGQVVMVRDCFAAGRAVVLWHGAGLYTTYFHLSQALVSEGERVERGQRLGLVGRSGRASGPHLHWGVRVGDLYVDPRSVLRLRLPSPG